jgi:hypothetical protein
MHFNCRGGLVRKSLKAGFQVSLNDLSADIRAWQMPSS